MTGLTKLTTAQRRMLLAYYRGEGGDRQSRNLTRVVRERLMDNGYLSPRNYSARGNPLHLEVTAKGLRAISATPNLIYERERLELDREVKANQEYAARAARVHERAEERKAKIIAKVREENIACTSFRNYSDDDLWQAITRIVEIHEAG